MIAYYVLLSIPVLYRMIDYEFIMSIFNFLVRKRWCHERREEEDEH